MTTPYAFLAETHSAVVVGLGDRVVKLRKPVDLGFLDQRTVEQRRQACEREVTLNRRFSPDTYLGVGTLASPDPDAAPEPVVVMRRLPDERRLTHLISSGLDLTDEIRRIAHVVAGYHAVAPQLPAAAEAASTGSTRSRWDANTREMQHWVGDLLDPDTFERVARRARRYLDGRRPLFDRRIADGWARDGHGDLLADDIFCLDDGPRVLDCLDFDEGLRVGDVLADAAFLAMDLERLGRPDLGEVFLHAHAEFLGDHWPPSLAHHHIAYRAQVRAKVSCIRADQGEVGAAERARALLEMADHHLHDGTVRLVLVGGAPGTGKSSLSAALGDELDVAVLRADRVRKELAGLDPSTDAGDELDRGLYTEERTRETYAELLERARRLLEQGMSVVLDAGWRDATHRADARRVADETHAVLVQLECTAPEAVALGRIAHRRATESDASDVDDRVARALRARATPWPEAVAIDTEATPPACVRDAAATIRAAG